MNETILNGESMDIVADNIQKLKEIFPDVFTEGKVDFEKLEAVLGNYVEKDNERYNFTWHGKSQALRLAQTPSTGTLRPCKEESKDWDTTQNLYIEGDNLEVLKLLQKSYHNKIKMIYIDPPYNTGKDFVYPDNYRDNMENYLKITGQIDGEGNKITTNSESNGRFHTVWLNMVYPRLKLARNLLREDGLIFISIDDTELENTKKICNEIFGEENFLECLIWKKRATPPNDRNIGRIHEFILCYTKSIEKVSLGLLLRDDKSIARYSNPDNDPRGNWVASDLSANGKGGRLVESCVYPIINPKNGISYYPSEGRCWLFNKEKMETFISEGRVAFRENTGAPYLKRYFSEVRQGLTLPTILTEFGYSSTSSAESDKLFNRKGIFEYAKPTTLINPLVRVGAPEKDSIVLDFFSGSATTAEAVMQLNAEDNGSRRFILVQLPEKTKEKSEAYKAGFKNICEIGRERIKLSGHIIKDTLKETLDRERIDVGFKVLKLADSNIKKWNPDYDNIEATLYDHINNFVEGRTELDVVFEIMLKYGIDLTMPIDEYTLVGKKVYSVGFGALIICLDKEIDLEIAHEITKLRDELQPEVCRVVFRDNGFKNDMIKTNVKENLKVNHFDEIVSI